MNIKPIMGGLALLLAVSCSALQADRGLYSVAEGARAAAATLPQDPGAKLGTMDWIAAAGAFLATGVSTFWTVNRSRDARRRRRGEMTES